VTRFLVRLYPRAWRRRYGEEVIAHYGRRRLGLRDTLDLLGGALDAHLHPQWPRRWRWPRPALLIALLAAILLLAGVRLAAGILALVGIALLALRRRAPRHGGQPWEPDDPAAGARMPRKPYDPDPEPLEAVGQIRR